LFLLGFLFPDQHKQESLALLPVLSRYSLVNLNKERFENFIYFKVKGVLL
jgi:hypothetical protein